jgi:formylglycine-generating enzyme required for sulfatase activity
MWNGERIEPRLQAGRAVCSMTLEARGFGAILQVAVGEQTAGLQEFLARMRELARQPLNSFSSEWRSLPQQIVTLEPTRRRADPPRDMVKIPAAEFDFVVQGIEIEGQTWEGLDVQYPWEGSARRGHRRRISIAPFHIDRYPITNAQYKAFLDAASYRPTDDHNFLRHWAAGAPRAGWENKPVTWVSLEDARAYATWAGKRLPHEWEWQYAAQGTDSRRYPWGDEWNAGEQECEPDEAHGPKLAERYCWRSSRMRAFLPTRPRR